MRQYAANVAMKANLKFKGTNHTVKEVTDSRWMKDTMIIGGKLVGCHSIQNMLMYTADITHPGGGSLEFSPSVAAVVGSVDKDAARFVGQLFLQPNTVIKSDVSP